MGRASLPRTLADRHNVLPATAPPTGRWYRGATDIEAPPDRTREVITDDRHRIRLTEWPSTEGCAAGLVARAKAITERELARYAERTAGSQARHRSGPQGPPARRAVELPGLRPAPDRRPPRLRRADGRRRRQRVRRLRHGLRRPVRRPHAPGRARGPSQAQLDDGTLYVTPCELDAEVAELLADRYGLPMWRFTNSGTEATMDAIRVAKGGDRPGPHRQGRGRLPRPPRRGDDLDEAAARPGRPGRRADLACPARPGSPSAIARATPSSSRTTTPTALERVLAGGDVACFIVEPVMENIGICLPDAGYLRGGAGDHRRATARC